MAEHKLTVHEQFDTIEQQHEVARTGMWLFLASEVMFFGGLFMAFTAYHLVYPATFGLGGQHTNLLCGSINTLLLLTSGLTVALAVNAIQRGKIQNCVWFLGVTALLGVGFLVVKGFEYWDDIEKHLVPGAAFALPGRPASEMFFFLYWIMTSVHGLHLVFGIAILGTLMWFTSRGRYNQDHHMAIEIAALYWGFVDIIWIFLFPLLYLIDRHGHL